MVGVLVVAAMLALASASAPGATTHAPGRWCPARSSLAWRRMLSRHVIASSRTTAMVPLALAHDGRSFFASVYSRRFSGVGQIDARTGRLTRIKAFPNPKYNQAWAALDGRWLVWNEYHDFNGFNDFSTWAWDTHAHKLRSIGAATRGPTGRFWDSPWRGPDVRDGIMTWVQGVGPDQLGDVHSYNLRTGRDLVVREGHPGGAFLLDHHILVWAEASAPGIPTRMHAASALTGDPVPLPRALETLRNVTGLQTDGQRIAYPDASYKSLWWSPTLGATPYMAVGSRHLQHVDNSVQVAGRYVAFGIYPGVFIADSHLHRYVEVASHGGLALVNSSAVLVTHAPAEKVLHPILSMDLVRLRDLPPMPPCR
jgi:hypothetical protein